MKGILIVSAIIIVLIGSEILSMLALIAGGIGLLGMIINARIGG